MAPALIVIGYGNKLRSDDGFGPAVAERLRKSFAQSDAYEILVEQQLLPELAEVVASCIEAVLIDASVDLEPAEVHVEEIHITAGVSDTNEYSMTHALTPLALLSLCESLYKRVPRMTIYTCGVRTIELGEDLSHEVSAKVAPVARTIAERHFSTYAQPSVGLE